MKNFFGSIQFIIGLGFLIKIITTSNEVSWWVWVLALVLIGDGLEMVIKGLVADAKKESTKELKEEVEKLKDEIRCKENSESGKSEYVILGQENYRKDINLENGDDDELYEEAREIVISADKASVSYLQRKLAVGYARAARLLDLLEERGVIGPGDGAAIREVYEKSVVKTNN